MSEQVVRIVTIVSEGVNKKINFLRLYSRRVKYFILMIYFITA